jgi:hypothetical protein
VVASSRSLHGVGSFVLSGARAVRLCDHGVLGPRDGGFVVQTFRYSPSARVRFPGLAIRD